MKKFLKILISIVIGIVLILLIFPLPEGCLGEEDQGELVFALQIRYYVKNPTHKILYNSIEPVPDEEEFKEKTWLHKSYILGEPESNRTLIFRIAQCEDPTDIRIDPSAYYSNSLKRFDYDPEKTDSFEIDATKPGRNTICISYPGEDYFVIIIDIVEDITES